jgi:RNA polymerase sigma-70 factor (ECF subfamily)
MDLQPRSASVVGGTSAGALGGAPALRRLPDAGVVSTRDLSQLNRLPAGPNPGRLGLRMQDVAEPTETEEDPTFVAAIRGGDEKTFTSLARRHQRELQLHCYRMLGSLDEAEDLGQETLLRAWRHRTSFEGRASARAWLYRIATNACFDRLAVRRARLVPIGPGDSPSLPRVPWMQPYPDDLLDEISDAGGHPESLAIRRETIELAFLTAIQALPPKQRAALLLRDVVGFSAVETADSALQRGRATLSHRKRPVASPTHTQATFDEAILLQALVDAQERGDVDAIVRLLRDDVRMTLYPTGETWNGRDAVAAEHYRLKTRLPGQARSVPIAANRQPAVAIYVRRGQAEAFVAWAIVVVGVVEGKLSEIATFESPALFARFDLPPTFNDGLRERHTCGAGRNAPDRIESFRRHG